MQAAVVVMVVVADCFEEYNTAVARLDGQPETLRGYGWDGMGWDEGDIPRCM